MATAHPSFTSPITWPPGTRTSVKKTSANPACASSCTIGRASTPGERMSSARKVIPAWRGASGSVRTSANIQSAYAP